MVNSPILLQIFLEFSILVCLVRSFVIPGYRTQSSALYSGFGVAPHYTWKEEAFEIDLKVQVPAGARAKNIKFVAKVNSIDLRYVDGDEETVLLDGTRKLRGRVNTDGTYWVLSDYDESERSVTVTIEKLVNTDFEVVDYDWKGVYSNDTEVVERFYDKPETLNIREYAASLGVDIDNINMSMVDKTMFSSGLNMSNSALNELTKAGYLSEDEVTVQADGTEYKTNEDGSPEQISKETKPIPFLDAPQADTSSWESAVPVTKDPNTNQTVVRQIRNFTKAAFEADSSIKEPKSKMSEAKDPIDTLTVKRLQEILKAQGLKTTGNKAELKARLRARVNSLLQGNQEE